MPVLSCRPRWPWPLAGVLGFLPALTHAQTPTAPPPDTAAYRLAPAQVTGTRAAAADPVPFTPLGAPRADGAYVGQELPIYLRTAPNVTATSDAGSPFGYTYYRLRGIDQTRLNVSLDGIPLNEPEDQGAYFVNLPGFADHVASVQVQRGTGTSPNGTAPLGGSLNFLTIRPEGSGPRLMAELTGGAFGTARASVGARTGPTASGFSAYGRLTAQRTDGYRTNGFHQGLGGAAALAWTGRRTVVRLLVLAGQARNGMAYLASPVDSLRADRRHNPLTPAETDRFRQQLVGLTVSHATGAHGVWTTTAYGNFLQGHYGLSLAPDPLLTFDLRARWGGLLTTWHYAAGAWTLDVGAHANTYARTHRLYAATVADALYANTGRKQEVSGFGKVAWQPMPAGPRFYADVNARRAAFQYHPDAHAGVPEATVAWAFLNPKLGLTQAVGGRGQVFASVGRTRREPTRNDLLAGFDNLDTTNAAFVGSFRRVRPEQVTDYEVGVRWERPGLRLALTAYALEFRHEIAAIGQLSYIGLPLRQNVDRSSRRGLELEAAATLPLAIELTANLTLNRARIAAYTDGATGQTYRHVAPLLSPVVTAAGGLRVPLPHGFGVQVNAAHQGRAFLANTGDGRFRLPAATFLDAGLSWTRGGTTLSVVAMNLLDARYTSGYTDGATSLYFVAPPPHVFATVRLNLFAR